MGAVLLAAVLLAACSLNPIGIAVTPEQKYNAALLTYDAVLEPALELIEDETAPADLRRVVRQAVLASGEVYTGATEAYAGYTAAKASGDGTQTDLALDTLRTALTSLESAIAGIQALTKN